MGKLDKIVLETDALRPLPDYYSTGHFAMQGQEKIFLKIFLI
jgi:hypothetical protein